MEPNRLVKRLHEFMGGPSRPTGLQDLDWIVEKVQTELLEKVLQLTHTTPELLPGVQGEIRSLRDVLVNVKECLVKQGKDDD